MPYDSARNVYVRAVPRFLEQLAAVPSEYRRARWRLCALTAVLAPGTAFGVQTRPEPTGLVLPVVLGIGGLVIAAGCFVAGRLWRRASEAARGEALETLRAAIDAAPVAIYSLALNGEVRLWNRAAEQIFGW